MSIVKAVLINGCSSGGVGSSIALALAGRSVHVFACSSSLSSMSELSDIPNITLMKLDPISLPQIYKAERLIRRELNGGTLNVVINTGHVGLEPPPGSSKKEIADIHHAHIFSSREVCWAFEHLVVAGQGAIINITCPKTHEYVRSINVSRQRLAAKDVSVVTVSYEALDGGTALKSDGPGDWRDASALAHTIMDDIFRFPGHDHVL